MSGMGDEMARRMIREGFRFGLDTEHPQPTPQSEPPIAPAPLPRRPKRIAVDRVIPSYNEGTFNWPEMSPYGSLTFHAHIAQLVALWNSFPMVDNPTATMNESAAAMGYTTVHFGSFEECGQFCHHHMLHDAILDQTFTDGGGYVQIRNSYPKEFVDSFLSTIAQGNSDLQIAVNRVQNMMQASRSAMISMTRQLDSER